MLTSYPFFPHLDWSFGNFLHLLLAGIRDFMVEECERQESRGRSLVAV